MPRYPWNASIPPPVGSGGGWSWAIATGRTLAGWFKSVRIAGENKIVAMGPAGLLVVDPATGRTTSAAGVVAVCKDSIEAHLPDATYKFRGQVWDTYYTGDSCTSAMRPAEHSVCGRALAELGGSPDRTCPAGDHHCRSAGVPA